MSASDGALAWSKASDPANSAKDFGERHDLHGWALPFRGRPIDPLDFIKRAGEYLNSRPPYCQRVTHDVLNRELNPEDRMWWNSDFAEMTMLTHGWWLVDEVGRSRYYCNPEYCHRHPVSDIYTDPDTRRALLRKASGLGLIDPSEIAPMFGFSGTGERAGNSVLSISHRLGFPWGQRRTEGTRRMDRTWKTLSQWEYSQRDIAQAFGVSQPAVSRAVNRVSEFQPPDDPTVDVAK